MATAATKAMATLCLVLLFILQSCHVLEANNNIDPRQLPDAYVYISSLGFPGYYLAVSCSALTVQLQTQKHKFQFAPSPCVPLSYNIRVADCPSYYIRLDATGSDPYASYPDGVGTVSVTTNVTDPKARYRPVPQLSVPNGNGFYALLSDDVSYAYLRVSTSVVNAQNGIGGYEQLTIATY